MPQYKLPTLHVNQQPIFNSIVQDRQRNTVLVAGRRFGKSKLALVVALEYAMNKGYAVWWISPTFGIAKAQWRDAKNIVRNRFSEKNEVDKRLTFNFRNDDGKMQYGSLTFKSADKYDNLRGEGLDLVIFDEAAFMQSEVWTVMRPALVDKKGQAIFISTPNGLNWFYQLFNLGNDPTNEYWRSWHFTSYDNPTLPDGKKEIDAAKRDMMPAKFEQEHMAIFSDNEGRIFRNIAEIATSEIMPPKAHGLYVMGVDWGRSNDATVISIIDADTKCQVYLDRFTDTNWSIQNARLKAAIIRYHPVKVLIEENAAGSPMIERLISEGMKNIIPFKTSSVSKPLLIDTLALAIEQQTIRILSPLLNKDAEIQLAELRSYEQTQNASGHWQYNAPAGLHDDTVIALALCVHALLMRRSGVKQSVNFFYEQKEPTPRTETKLNEYKKRSNELKKKAIEQDNMLRSR